jgi:hypothetical protein
LLVTVNADPSSLVLVTLVMDAIRSAETVLTRATRRHIPEDGIHSKGRENILKNPKKSKKSYNIITLFILSIILF